MKIKLNLKTVIIAISSFILILMIILLSVLAIASHKPTAAFYGLSERNQKQITAVLQTTHSRKNKKSLPFNIVVLDDSLPVEKALKKNKADILFIYGGANEKTAENIAVKKGTTFDQSLVSNMSSSIRQSTTSTENRIPAVPLLSDNYELDINIEKLNTSPIETITTMADVEELARLSKASTSYPVVFAAGEDEKLINLFGAITEAVAGHDKAKAGEEKLKKLAASGKANQNSYFELLQSMCEEGGEYHETYTLLKRWISTDLLKKNFSRLKTNDLKIFMGSSYVTAAFITLSDHRTFERNEITKYESTFIPGTSTNQYRVFVAPIIYGISLSNDKVARNAIVQLSDILQTKLSSMTGLAPVQKSCGVPDVQADDVRYWVAASNPPSQGLANELFTTRQQKALFAETIRILLK